MSRIFTRRWVCVGQLGSLKEPGSFLSGLYMDMPWVVTRHAEDNQLRAFHNVSMSCHQHACCDCELVLTQNENLLQAARASGHGLCIHDATHAYR